jgi:cytosine/adenosine deaminase-related metal-dependent hydrolase
MPRPATDWSLTARWVFCPEMGPQEGGTVTIRGDRIAASAKRGRRAAGRDLGNAAIIPGLVNAHTHLDLTGLRGRCPPTADFTAWLRGVIAHRRRRTPAQVQADIRAGLAEAVASGTTLLADISAGGQSWDVLAQAPVRAVVFYELLGLTEARAEQSLAEARAWLESHPATPTCRPGLSPHAPYSVRASLFAGATRLARKFRCPLAVHLAESPAELQLLQGHTGPFVPFLQELGAWDPEGLVAGPEEVLKLCGGSGLKLFIHANYLRVPRRTPRNSSVVHCPRTHAAFGHPLPDFGKFFGRFGVGLGTDSLASSPGLDLLGEMRCLRARCQDTGMPFSMATVGGAAALGWWDEGAAGRLTPGNSADLAVLDLPDEAPADPLDLIYHPATRVRAVLFRGRWVAGSGPAGEP